MALMYEGRASTRGVDANDVVVHPAFDEVLRDDRAHGVHELDLAGFSRSKACSIALFHCEPECLAGYRLLTRFSNGKFECYAASARSAIAWAVRACCSSRVMVASLSFCCAP